MSDRVEVEKLKYELQLLKDRRIAEMNELYAQRKRLEDENFQLRRDLDSSCITRDQLMREKDCAYFEGRRSQMEELTKEVASLRSRVEELERETEKYLAAFEGCTKDLHEATERCLLAESERDRWHKAFGDETLKHSETVARVEALEKALWGFDYNPGGGLRGYFCAGCDMEPAERNDPKYEDWHDPECRAARSVLSTRKGDGNG